MTRAFALFLLLMVTGRLFPQNNRKPLLWTSVSGDFSAGRVAFSAEIENSRLLVPNRQDYFTMLAHAEVPVDKLRLGAGASRWTLYDERERPVPEWRPHVQFKWIEDENRLTFLQRCRIENRWIRDTAGDKFLDTYSYTLRPRFLFQLGYNARGRYEEPGNVQAILSSELILEYNNSITGFSENRFYAGTCFFYSSRSALQLGYMWIYARHDRLNNSDIVYITWRNRLN